MRPPTLTVPVIGPDFRHDAVWCASSTPQERLARVAARRAFVEMKQCFMNAAAEAVGSNAELLRQQVRQTADVQALWRLHRAVMDSLPADNTRGEMHRRELRDQIDSAFPDAGGDTEFAPL